MTSPDYPVNIEAKLDANKLIDQTKNSRTVASFDNLMGTVLSIPANLLGLVSDPLENLRKQRQENAINFSKIAQKEIEERHIKKPQAPNSKFLYTLFDYATLEDDKEVQKIWAQLLATEIEKPQSISKRTLTILSEMEPQEAKSFEAIRPFIISNENNLFVPNILGYMRQIIDSSSPLTSDSIPNSLLPLADFYRHHEYERLVNAGLFYEQDSSLLYYEGGIYSIAPNSKVISYSAHQDKEIRKNKFSSLSTPFRMGIHFAGSILTASAIEILSSFPEIDTPDNFFDDYIDILRRTFTDYEFHNKNN